MGDRTGIAWTDATWNPIRGCSRVSAGCGDASGGGCYAIREAHRMDHPGGAYEGLTRIRKVAPTLPRPTERAERSESVGLRPPRGPDARHLRSRSRVADRSPPQEDSSISTLDWSGEVRFVPEKLDLPLRWRKPRRIFVASMSDPFHPSLPFEQIAMIWAVFNFCHRREIGHVFQVLTKRPERVVPFFEWLRREEAWMEIGDAFRAHGLDSLSGLAVEMNTDLLAHPLPNVHLGVSVEDQATANERIPVLLRCPAALHWVSLEPQLEEVDLRHYLPPPKFYGTCPRCEGSGSDPHSAALLDCPECEPGPRLLWAVQGGESGPRARPFDLAWARKVRDQCRMAGTPWFCKQLGSNPVSHAPDRDFPRDRGGADPSEWPEDLRLQLFPGDPWPT